MREQLADRQRFARDEATDAAPVELTDRIIPQEELLTLVPLSRTTLARLEDQGRFPRRVQLSDRRVGWYRSEIANWIANRHRAWGRDNPVLVNSFIDGERVTVGIVGEAVEVRVERDGRAETMRLSAEHLQWWCRDFAGKKLIDTCWRHGINLDPLEPMIAKNPRPCPAIFSHSAPSDVDPVMVALVEINGVKLVEVRVGHGDKAKAVTFNPLHLNAFRSRSMGRASIAAWKAGLATDGALMNL